MSKRLALVLVMMFMVPALLAACSSESRDTAEEYVEAVLGGKADEAEKLACDSFKAQTRVLAEAYGELDITGIDFKYDTGKGQNQEEIIVTGSYKLGPGDDAKEVEISEGEGTRIVIWLEQDGGDWCVTDKTEFAGTGMGEAPAMEEPAAEATAAPAEATPEATEAAQ